MRTHVFASSFVVLSFVTVASADDALPPPGGVPLAERPGTFEIDGYAFRPLVDLRLRGAYVAADPSSYEFPVTERSRLGLAFEKGAVGATLVLQDQRRLHSDFAGDGTFEPFEAYIDVHSEDREVFARLGRQTIVLGKGDLIGENDLADRSFGSRDLGKAHSFDALRAGFRVGDWDLQGLAALLAIPDPEIGPGAQLYALDATWHIFPVFQVEFTAIAQLVRLPIGRLLPADTIVGSARVFGDERGVSYSVIGAFQGGRRAVVGDLDTVVAGGVKGNVAWETSLPWRLTFGAQGAYASASSEGAETDANFDPLFVDDYAMAGRPGFYTWRNIIEGGADISVRPIEEIHAKASYRFLGAPEKNAPWYRAGGAVMGPAGETIIGHQIGATVELSPWEPLTFAVDYAALLLAETRLGQEVMHHASLEARLRLPEP